MHLMIAIMRLMMVIVALILIIAGASVLFMFFNESGATYISHRMAPYMCRDDEEIQVRVKDEANEGYNDYCVDNDGNRRNVGWWNLLPMAIAGTGLTGGIILLFREAQLNRKKDFDREIKKLAQEGKISARVADIMTRTIRGNHEVEALKDVFAAVMEGELLARLHDLDSALDEGLIDTEEYERTRQALLANLAKSESEEAK